RQAFAGIEADDEAPLLPAHLIAIHSEAGPFRLRDVDGLDVLALVVDAVGGVVAIDGWQRPMAVFLDADDFHLVEIDDGPQAFDGPDVAVVGRVFADEAERPG